MAHKKLILLFVTFLVFVDVASSRFRHKPIFRQHPRKNETFVYFPEEESKTDFHTALGRCKSIGSLAHPRDQEDQDFIFNMTNGHYVWLGSRLENGFGFFQERSVKIVDSLAKSSDFENWDRHEPNCIFYCCANQIVPNGFWRSFLCTNDAHVLCRIKSELVDSVLEDNRVWIKKESPLLQKETAVKKQTTPLTTTRTSRKATNDRITEAKDNAGQMMIQLLEELTLRVVNLEKQNMELKEANSRMNRQLEETAIRVVDQVTNSTKEYVDRSLNAMSEDFRETIRSLIKLIEDRQ
jgi:hypothetical protein